VPEASDAVVATLGLEVHPVDSSRAWAVRKSEPAPTPDAILAPMEIEVRTEANVDVDDLMRRCAKFLLRNSAEGTFDLQSGLRSLAAPYGATLEALTNMEGIVLIITHADGTQHSSVVHAQPTLERLDQVSEFKFLTEEIARGELSARQAIARIDALEHSRPPFPWWVRFIGVVLFAAGFAPSIQPSWRELWESVVLGGVMAVVYLLGEQTRVLRTMLPLIASSCVALVDFGVFHDAHAAGGPVLVMVPALFVMIPGDFLCAAAAEIAVGEFTVGTIRLVQSFFILFQLAGGVLVGAFLTGVGTDALVSSTTVSNIPWILGALAWIPFTFGLAFTFCARFRDVGWLLGGVYAAWCVQLLFTWLFDATAGTFVAAAVLTFAGILLSAKSNRPPSLVMILGGVFVLTVGSMALRGITTATSGNLVDSFRDFTDFVLIAGGLSFGLIVGTGLGLNVLRRRNSQLSAATSALR
jgi:uncharacterized membrane protein YjjB (DUF3815 family)